MFQLISPLKHLCLLFDTANYASDWKKIKDFQKKKKAPHCPDFNICLLLSRRSRYYGPGRGHRVQACTVMNIRLLSHGKTRAILLSEKWSLS